MKNIPFLVKKSRDLLVHNLVKKPIKNYYKTNYSKNALLSYITFPFIKGVHIKHTNTVEALEISAILKQSGYNIDVVEFNYEGYLDFDRYDLIFGFGDPVMNSFRTNKRIKRIYYGTGRHPVFQNHDSMKRVEEVYNKTGVWMLESARLVEKAWAPNTTLVDAVIAIGNEDVKRSYEPYFNKRILTVPASIYKLYNYLEIIHPKDFKTAKDHFLWFGSMGMIHKGLDLLLEIFKEEPYISLHICGSVEDEPKFEKVYYNELYKTKNIFTYGFVNIDSGTFKELLTKCAFIIYPTCSEGGSPAVLNICGNGGLLPLVTKEATIDVDDFGFIIESITKADIKNAIAECRQMDEETLRNRSVKCGEYVVRNHLLKNFSEKLKENINLILNNGSKD